MAWATEYINKLKKGETVKFRPRGNSMTGKINSGQLCTVSPIGERKMKKGDIVLCRVSCREYIHLIKAKKGNQYQIGNNKGGINGWITASSIYGILTNVS